MKKIPFILFIFSFLWIGSVMPGDHAGDHVPGQLIIQLEVSGEDRFPQVTEKLTGDFSHVGMKMAKVLSARMGICLFEFDSRSVAHEALLLEQVKGHRLVRQAQFNHYVTLRETEPDDPSYPEQWALKNTGQLMGTIDADIDATDAWDISTGGVTALGDTIIIAIIDDGFDLGHDDIDFWENHHEVPSNGIDDDGNGYVDDYRGWNAYVSNGTITSRDHGTHVTGIAGAIGNNATGISGINWNVRILPVMGSSLVESVVVEAYGYVYAQRARYNETNGALGAYIVVSNCSFGVDYGQAEEFPVWGAMYDSLGKVGILSSGATANMNVNVDEVGDIPTTFESDYLITVTNTTMQDEKYLAAAWGPVSIDLGAPGKSILSTRLGNSYGYKTGTSMSAPHISGAVALMFAAAEPAFLESYHANLSTVSLLFKHYILNGVDILPGLVDSTVSEGRLNIKKAIDLLLHHVLESDTDTLKSSINPDSTELTSFDLINTADLEMAFNINTDGLPPWLSVEPGSGVIPAGSSVEIIAGFDANGMDPGTYFASIGATNIRGDQVTIIARLTVKELSGTLDEATPSNTITVFPNPFSNIVHIGFHMDRPAHVRVSIFNQQGGQICSLLDGWHPAGYSEVPWDGRDQNGGKLPGGIYYCSIRKEGRTFIARLLYVP